ncbi:MAG: DnaJ C-terminal domain-containing protein [Rhodomicrobium sp.]
MADPYQTLGLTKTATDEEIRKAYRKLAKEHHPDLNPGNKQAEARFKDISAAYTFLSDPEKRRAFDAGEIDASGTPQAERRFYRDYAGAGAGGGFRYEQPEDLGGFEDLGDVFSGLFRGQRADPRGGAETQFRMRGGDAHYTLPVDFLEAVNGAKKRVDMPDGKTLDIAIPAGVQDGQILRLKGQGMAGLSGGAAGDALITVSVRPHPVFRRDGNGIKSVLPITLSEALLGGSVPVETVTGPVSLKIPKHSNTGRMLRLRGKGVQGKVKGDHLVELQVVMPPNPDDALEKAVSEWEGQHPYNPRTGGTR